MFRCGSCVRPFVRLSLNTVSMHDMLQSIRQIFTKFINSFDALYGTEINASILGAISSQSVRWTKYAGNSTSRAG